MRTIILAVIPVSLFLSGCSKKSMSTTDFYREFTPITKSTYYDYAASTDAIEKGECKILTYDRIDVGEIDESINEDLMNGARGVDAMVLYDGGNAYRLTNYEWRLTIEGSILHVYFDTMLCE